MSGTTPNGGRFCAYSITGARSLRGGFSYEIPVMLRGEKSRCGKCGRGIVIEWPMGYEPKIRSCRVCGSETDVYVMGCITAKGKNR